jgi:peptidyl-prolyl cis-trans isomerase C
VELAKEHTGLEAEEVNMGYIKQGQNMPEIEAMVFSMVPGEISPILATAFGFHLFTVTGRKEPSPIPMDEVPNLEETFLSRRRENRIGDIIDKLKEEGSVEEVEEQVV